MGVVLGLIYAVVFVVLVMKLGLYGINRDYRKREAESVEGTDPLDKESNYWW